MMEKETRRLLSPAAGRIFPARELDTADGGGIRFGEGFAVSAEGISRLYYRLAPAAEIAAPVSGVLTSVESGGFRLRTGDGTEIQVNTSGEGEYFLRVGELVRAGEPVCRISREAFTRGRAGAVVTFGDSTRITELHIFSGIKRSGELAAEYIPLSEPKLW